MSAKPEALPTPGSIARYVKQNMQKARKSSPMMMAMMQHEGGQEIVREDDYQGHHVVVRTTYNITVDGQEVTGHIMLTNAGQVQYHGLPNHSFDSTIGLVRALIDNFPEDFEKKKPAAAPHGGMATGGKRAPMSGMKMPGMGAARPPKAASKKAAKKATGKSKQRAARSKSK
jgi:hypothetical protein